LFGDAAESAFASLVLTPQLNPAADVGKKVAHILVEIGYFGPPLMATGSDIE
jgi:hypothetical protein